jgi:hypothetical protein
MRAVWLSVVAGAIALVGALGLRVSNLESRVSALSARVPAREGASQPSARAGHAATTDRWSAAYERHLGSLEERARALPQPSAAASGRPQTPDSQILEVVERENSRIRDGLLDFHQKYWLDQRKAALGVFAQNHGLSNQQKSALEGVLTRELDALVGLLRKPIARDNPRQVQQDWRATIDASDASIRGLLTAEQFGAWQQQRSFERSWLNASAAAAGK